MQDELFPIIELSGQRPGLVAEISAVATPPGNRSRAEREADVRVAAPLSLLSGRSPSTVLDVSFFSTWPIIGMQEVTAPQTAALATLGVRIEDYECFLRFVGHPFDFCTKKHGKSWRSAAAHWALSHNDLRKHLRGDHWIATGCPWNPRAGSNGRAQTWFFVIDLDNRQDADDLRDFRQNTDDLRDRYARVVAALGWPSLVFRSSGSGGLHLYYLLSAPVDLFRLKSKHGGRGVVERLLAGHGVRLGAGAVEFFPTTKLREGSRGNRLRIPFGAECALLCPTTLSVLAGTGLTTLRFVTDGLASGNFRTYEFGAFLAAAEVTVSGRRAPRRKGRSRKKSGSRQEPRDLARATELLAAGLTQNGELDIAIGALAFYYRREGCTEQLTVDAVLSWLAAKNNGVSDTYNNDPEEAASEVRQKVSAIYKKHGLAWGNEPLPGLSITDVARIVHATSSRESCVDPRTGRALKRLVLQRALFESMRYAKQWILRNGENALRRASEDAGGHPSAQETAVRFRTRAWWPDTDRSEFIVPYSYRKRTSLKGMRGRSGAEIWRAALATGLYVLHSEASWEQARSAEFRVALDLRVHVHEFTSLECALRELLGKDGLHALYTDHYRKVIRRSEGHAELRIRGPFEHFVSAAATAYDTPRRAA